MKPQIVSFSCVLKTKLGKEISRTVSHDVLNAFEPNQTQLLGLSEGLQNLREGEKRRIDVPAERAYGFYDPKKVVVCAREELAAVKVGDKVPGHLRGQKTVFRVTSLTTEEVVLDANHPLAGQDLVFEIEALDVREATQAEVLEAGPEKSVRFH